jgi:signal transduction histidine kinase
LENAAEILRKATNADAVLVYTGTPRHMKVRFSRPENENAFNLNIVPQSLTAESLKSREPRRLLEVETTKQNVDHEQAQLTKAAQLFGWERVRSWLCCPIVHEQQCTGLIKLLTNEAGVVFGKDHETIVRVVAERTAMEMYKASRRVVLEELLQLSNELAGMVGAPLGQGMVDRLKDWVKDRLLRPLCEVAVVSRLETGGILIKQSSAGIAENLLGWLESRSIEWNKEERTWSTGSLVLCREPREVLPLAGHAAAIRLPGTKLLGHLILLDEEPFAKNELEAIRQAADYMAVLLNIEWERLREKQEMGRFRHAVMGPVQGVTSAALLLAGLAEQAGAERAQVERLRTRLNVEAQVIRLWRENQRFYQSENVQVKPRRQELKLVIDRCVERFRDLLGERNISLLLSWPFRGNLPVLFDADAIDLVLSNLLDNSRKYSFFNQTVTVGAKLLEGSVAVWIEDVGHGFPDEAESKIYRLGRRFVEYDKWRTISGEGLGLAMSAAIVHAHGGDLTHSSIKLGEGRHPDTTPYRVRFTFTLPLSWRGH